MTFLIDVAKNLPDITFKIVGTGYQQDILQKKIKTDGLKNVIILEYQSGKNLERLISKSYITILPSLWFENLPNSILESFSYGKPVLASRIGGIPELVRNGKTGLLFEAGNIKDCINKIMYLWNKPQFVNKMGIFASQVVKTKYNSDIHYHKLIKIYKKVIKSNV